MSANGSNAENININSDSLIVRIKFIDNLDILRRTRSWSAAFAMTGTPIPVIAALTSVAIYIVMGQSQWSKLVAISGGALLALSAWLIAAIGFYRSTAVDRANASSYQQLINRLYQLGAWIEALKCEQQGNSLGSGSEVKMLNSMCTIQMKEVHAVFDAICHALEKEKNSSWMWAIGYVNLWRLIHRADEALIAIEPTREVIRDALHDEMNIMGSKIDNRYDLLIKLRLAVKTLSEQGAIYLNRQPPEQKETGGNGSHGDCVHIVDSHGRQLQGQAVAPGQGNHTNNSPAHSEVIAQARTIIREVRFSLHQFRDDRWEKLIRVRNHLMRITILTGLAIYLLVAFVIIIMTKTELPMLEAASIFYLIGAIVSLFSRLYYQSRTDSSIDDFRLAAARLIAAPVFSGLAAVGGVLIVMKMSIIQPSALFELNLANVIVAAVFGLTPSLFVTTFQKQADQYKAELKSTQAPAGEQEKTLPSE